MEIACRVAIALWIGFALSACVPQTSFSTPDLAVVSYDRTMSEASVIEVAKKECRSYGKGLGEQLFDRAVILLAPAVKKREAGFVCV